jgi:hypothetical protein
LSRRWLARLGLLAPVVAGAVVVAGSAKAGPPAEPHLGPKPAKCGTGCWGTSSANLYGGGTLSVSYLGDVDVEPKLGRVGKPMKATFTVWQASTTGVDPATNRIVSKPIGWTWPFPVPGSTVFSPSNLSPVVLLKYGLTATDVVKSGRLPALPSLKSWEAGDAPPSDWSLKSSGPVAAPVNGWQYFGYPRSRASAPSRSLSGATRRAS